MTFHLIGIKLLKYSLYEKRESTPLTTVEAVMY